MFSNIEHPASGVVQLVAIALGVFALVLVAKKTLFWGIIVGVIVYVSISLIAGTGIEHLFMLVSNPRDLFTAEYLGVSIWFFIILLILIIILVFAAKLKLCGGRETEDVE